METRNEIKFSHYYCKDGICTPVNPYTKMTPQFEANADHEWFKSVNSKWAAFETFAQSNTVSCPEDLMGEYRVEDCEIVWQSRLKGTIEWYDVFPEVYEKSNNHFTSYREYCDSMGAFARLFLQLKPVVKDQEPQINEFKEGAIYTIDEKFNNSGNVRLIKLGKLISTVQDIESGIEWETMTNRLSRSGEQRKQYQWKCMSCDNEFNGFAIDNCPACKSSDLFVYPDTQPEVKQQFGEWTPIANVPELYPVKYLCFIKITDTVYTQNSIWYHGPDSGFETVEGVITHFTAMLPPPKSI